MKVTAIHHMHPLKIGPIGFHDSPATCASIGAKMQSVIGIGGPEAVKASVSMELTPLGLVITVDGSQGTRAFVVQSTQGMNFELDVPEAPSVPVEIVETITTEQAPTTPDRPRAKARARRPRRADKAPLA